jgi:hypothetical protein
MNIELPEPAAHLADSLPLYTEAQLLAAVLQEREACAQICDGTHPGIATATVAQAIRSRK